MKKKILCLLLALLAINLSFSHVVCVEAASGSCGTDGDGSNVTWVLDESGTLTISGSGKMKSYVSENAPWNKHRDQIKSVTIGPDVTSIGKNAFSTYTSLETFFYKEGLSLTNASIPSKTAKIAYNVIGQSDKIEVTLVSTSQDVTIKCNAMGEGYKIINVGGEITLEHTFSDTWSSDGNVHWKLCSVCSERQNEGLHSFEQKSNSDNHWEECNVCNKKQNEEAHSFKQKSDSDKHWKVCSVCGAIEDKAKHTWDNGIVIKGATCTEAGTRLYTCTKCNVTKNETIPALEHTLSNTWSSDDFNHWKECSVCGAIEDKAKHTWDNGIYKVATCTEAGTERYTCTDCNATKEETISDVLGHAFFQKNFDPTADNLGGTKYTCIRCGYECWKNLTRDSAYSQTLMPDGETVYRYCTRNGLAAETTVDVGDGQVLKVFLQDPLGVLKKKDSDVLGISVKYVEKGSARYNELMSQVDGDHPIEHINFFEVYPTVNGIPETGTLNGSVYMEYEIPEGWDESDLEMILVRDGDDQEFDEKVLEIDGKKYLAMWKNHFSPYAMIDKLTDEEKAALIAQQIENMSSANSGESADNSKYLSSQVRTGDNSSSVALMSSAMLITSWLFVKVYVKEKAKYQKALI